MLGSIRNGYNELGRIIPAYCLMGCEAVSVLKFFFNPLLQILKAVQLQCEELCLFLGQRVGAGLGGSSQLSPCAAAVRRGSRESSQHLAVFYFNISI